MSLKKWVEMADVFIDELEELKGHEENIKDC